MKFFRLAVLVICAVGLATSYGCEEEDTWVPRPRKKRHKAKKSSGEASSQDGKAKAAAHKFVYNPVGKRDPFRSYLSVMKEEGAPKQERKLEKTEKFELDQYKLVALISGTSQPRAMVEDPNRDGHIIRIGSRLGKNGGRITRISNNSIVVVEEFRAPTGERIRVPITVKLPVEEELAIEAH